VIRVSRVGDEPQNQFMIDYMHDDHLIELLEGVPVALTVVRAKISSFKFQIDMDNNNLLGIGVIHSDVQEGVSIRISNLYYDQLNTSDIEYSS
jgi:hypothetical protein